MEEIGRLLAEQGALGVVCGGLLYGLRALWVRYGEVQDARLDDMRNAAEQQRLSDQRMHETLGAMRSTMEATLEVMRSRSNG